MILLWIIKEGFLSEPPLVFGKLLSSLSVRTAYTLSCVATKSFQNIHHICSVLTRNSFQRFKFFFRTFSMPPDSFSLSSSSSNFSCFTFSWCLISLMCMTFTPYLFWFWRAVELPCTCFQNISCILRACTVCRFKESKCYLERGTFRTRIENENAVMS